MNDDLEALEADLSDEERELAELLKESLLKELDGVEDAGEKAQKAALLSIRKDRLSSEATRGLVEGIDNPEESDSEDVAAALEADIEASRRYREYLEEIGVYPMTP